MRKQLDLGNGDCNSNQVVTDSVESPGHDARFA